MKIFDKNDTRIDKPDLAKGYLRHDKRFVKHHEAVEAVPEEGHWKTIAEYANGGKDVEWVVDVPAVEAKEAWDEYEDVQRYVEFTEEELARRNRPTIEERLINVESKLDTIIQLLSGKGDG